MFNESFDKKLELLGIVKIDSSEVKSVPEPQPIVIKR